MKSVMESEHFWVAIEDIRENPTIVLLENSSIVDFSFEKVRTKQNLNTFILTLGILEKVTVKRCGK